MRLKKQIGQTELAKRVGVSRQTIHAIETGKYVPSVLVALKISLVLRLPVEKLFYLKGGEQ